MSLDALAAALRETDPQRKCRAVAVLKLSPEDYAGDGRSVSLAADTDGIPGRPAQPELIEPAKVPRRRLGSAAGRAALIHAIAHIEFNAINLALDACWRFRGMPAAYYQDWLSVAVDEARHFQLLAARLSELGHAYGDFPAHNGLWEAAEKTAHDVLTRMALVPRVLEARGLDVTPGMIERLRSVGDMATVEILQLILREEVRHVQVGTHWFHFCCAQQDLAPDQTFVRLLAEYNMNVRPPLNEKARTQAGFSARELALVLAQADRPA